MKRRIFALLAATFILGAACVSEAADGKILIAYFSLVDVMSEGADAVSGSTPYVGNTETAARQLQALTGGELFKITCEKVYPSLHVEASKIAKVELDSDARPKLTSHVKDMGQYDSIFIGFPIWWYREPMLIRSFLEEYDFSGKTIIPFCTSMAVDVRQSMEDIRRLCPDVKVLNGIRLETEQRDFMPELSKWLERIGYKSGK